MVTKQQIVNLFNEIREINTDRESGSLSDTEIAVGRMEMKNEILTLISNKFFRDALRGEKE